jgi:serine/threonine protein kinase
MHRPSEPPKSRAPDAVFAGRYRIVRRLGKGSMATVYEAERIADSARVALKLMRKELADDQKARHRFEREGRLGASIQSDHVVRVLDFGVDETTGAPYLCLEYVSADTLGDLVKKGPLSRAAATHLIRQLFDAVGAAHRAGIVHRDLKPDNILLPEVGPDAPPQVKVSDFGVAKSIHAASLVRTEAGLGTPLWTAPEQAKNGYVPSPESDVWALGLITYYVLTGRHYFKNAGEKGSIVDLARELVHGTIDPPSLRGAEQGVGGHLPDGFDRWFGRAVNRDTKARFPNADRAWEGLAPLLGLASRTDRPGAKRSVLLVGALGALALVLLLIAVLLLVKS